MDSKTQAISTKCLLEKKEAKDQKQTDYGTFAYRILQGLFRGGCPTQSWAHPLQLSL